MRRTTILGFVTAFPPATEHGGVPVSAYGLYDELQNQGALLRVITSDRNGGKRLNVPTNTWSDYCGIPVIYCKTAPGPYLPSLKLQQTALAAAANADLIISSGTLWNHAGICAHAAARKFGLPHVVYVHGLLNPWAFKYRGIRKRVFWRIQGRRILNNASLIVALTQEEQEAIKGFGITAPIEVIPNGIDCGTPREIYDRDELDSQIPSIAGKRYLIFMARIHEIKGLGVLIPAFSRMAQSEKDVVLILAGPVESSFDKQLELLIAQSGMEHRILRTGPVESTLKNTLLHHASGFILPSFSEGFPMAVLEALSMKCPVIISRQCNIPEVREFDAGWVIEPEIESTTAAICELLSDGDAALRRAGRGVDLVMTKFSWKSIAKRTAEVFDRYCNTNG
jgi:glycosyltransferase involved in cell wall biosynthesis